MTTTARAVRSEGIPISVRDADPASDSDMETLAALHEETLPFGPVAQLGRRFLREVCYRALLLDGLMEAAIAEVDGKPAGFIAFTTRSITFHRAGLKRHWLLSGMVLATSLAQQPSLAKRVLPVVRLMASRRAEKERESDPLAELTAIGVKEEYRGAIRTDHSVRRVADELVKHAAVRFESAGFTTFRAVVDADNRATLLFYGGYGADSEPTDRGGRRSVLFTIPIEEILGDRPTAPPCWLQDSRSSVADAGWASYWEGLSSRHRIFSAESAEYVDRLLDAVPVPREARVLDFGCGFGHTAHALAPHVGEIAVWDAASNMRRGARLTLADTRNATFVDLSDPAAAATGCWDLILVHSVVQYLPEAELQAWLGHWQRMLVPGGRLIISDIPTPASSGVRELGEMLRFASSRSMLLPALRDGIAEAGRYQQQRATLPLTRLTMETLERRAAEAGLSARLLPVNLSYRRGRISVVFQPLAPPAAPDEAWA